MKIGDQIVKLEEAIDGLRADVAAIVEKSADEGRDITEEETTQIGALKADIDAKETSVKGLKDAEVALARRAEAREKAAATPTFAAPKSNEKASDMLFKMAHVAIRAHEEKKSTALVAQERYGHDPRVLDVMKAATDPAYTSVAGWAQELTDTALIGFIDELQAVSVYGRLAANGVALPFGNNNAITMPTRNGKGHVSGSFVGEGNTIPVKQDAYGSITFNRYKAAVITAFSNELARVSNPQIEALLRQHITTDTGDMLDAVLMGLGAAVAGIRPASPWNGADTQSSAGTDQASILTDLRFLFDTLAAQNAGRTPMLILNPARLSGLAMLTNANGAFVFRDEIASGRLMNVPYISSTNCPADHVFIIDAADFGTAFGNPEFDVSQQATLVMADDDGVAPTMADTNAISAGGSLHVSDAAGTTPPTAVRSMFQTWETALRMVLPISWGTMRPTVAYLTGVAW